MEKALHTAVGVRDIYGKELSSKRKIMEGIRTVLSDYSYEEIETPTFEYFDVFGKEVGTTPSRELYKFFDREGDTLVLRPDFTPSVARAVAMYFTEAPRPVRLWYEGNTFVNSLEYQGRLKESTQMGVERIGENTPKADAEVIALTVDALLAAGLQEFQVSIGEVEFFKSLAEEASLSEESVEEIRTLISRKNFFGVEEVLGKHPMQAELKSAFVSLPQLFGGAEVLKEAEKFAFTAKTREAIERLRVIEALLRKDGKERYVSFDFGMLSKYRYYTGIIFQAFTYGSGEPVAKGGRYDTLLSHFGTDDPAVGAGFQITPIMNALRNMRKEI
ncbi:MAG: ATP phosphoribosyltransferase regulatory subunit [Lachnospiraceae bacterium]|nr:ATP phosphoribosyltransferase regulatory subunit [Lachnospiraceae bacterium]